MTTPLPTRLRASALTMRTLDAVSLRPSSLALIDRVQAGRIAAELTDAADALEAGPWLPIETAPKDGTMFLCWVSAVRYGETDEGQPYQQDVSQIDFCQWRTQADIPDCGWFEPFCGQIGDEQDVTLWAPLPVAPGAQVAQEGAAGVLAADNWQRYAKDGETAQACIERHRREQDTLLKLLAQSREPLTSEQIIALLPAGWTGMLAQVMEFARRIEAARGVTTDGGTKK